LPYLRFTRDKRGYESTYVVHSVRRRGTMRQRILYWFRTPPNVRIGRAALDEDAIRAIEEHNPDIDFDWSQILEAQPPAAAADRPDRRRRPRAEVATGARGVTGAQGAMAARGAKGVVGEKGAVDSSGAPIAPGALIAPITPGAPSAPIAPSAPGAPETSELPGMEPPAVVPVTVYHGGADVLVATADDRPPRSSPVEARLGSEQLGRLRARHAEILARITERVGADPSRLEAMRGAAEALNPDAWVTDVEIAAALQQFDTRLGEIRRVLGIKRRRRSRRRGRSRHGGGRDRTLVAHPSAAAGEMTSEATHDEPEAPGDETAEELSDEGEDPKD